MERQRSQRRGWSALAPLLLLAAIVGRGGLVRVAQAQDTSADCTVTITQASDGSLLSEVVCTGDAEPNVTMWNRAWRNTTAFAVINHTATFSWNGAAPVPIPENDGRFADTTPALITIGFVPAAEGAASPYGDYPPYGTPPNGSAPADSSNPPYGSSTPPYGAGPPYGSSNPPYGSTPYGNYPGYPGGTAAPLPTLYVKAVMRNLSLPIGAVSFIPGSYLQQAISGVKLTAFSELVIQDSEVDGVSSAVTSEMTNFGAIKVVTDTNVMSNLAIVRVTNSAFRNGACSKDCGALFIQNPNAFELISIVDTNFTNNQGRGNGAGLYVDACPIAETNMHINGSFFTNNYAKGDGAGAFLGFGCSPIIYQSTFSGNRAGKSGAGFSLQAAKNFLSTLHVVDSTFADNIAAFDPCEANTCFDRIDRCGGAMHVNSPTTMRVEGSNFTGNTNLNGQNGGAVCYGQIIHDSRNLVVSCDGWKPLGSEGGIFRDCRFENNIAMFSDGFGGAIFDWASDGITLDACTFVNNTAGNGGAIYALRTQTVNVTGGTTFENCSATQFGGGAVAATHIQLTVSIDGAEFTSNICNSTDWSSSQGGAVYLEDSVEDLNGCPLLLNFTATITNVVFDKNECDTNGALAVKDVDDVIVGPNVNFTRNVAAAAPSSGGAVGIGGTSDNKRLAHPHRARFTGCRFDSNEAQSEGGALIIMGIWLPVIEDSLFFNNNVSTSSSVTLENYGGAVFVGELESDGITISRTRFIQNNAFGAGAMIVYATNLTMSDCEFAGNVCVETAGAYFWTQSATSVKPYQQTITNTTFKNNTAHYQGGAMLSQRSGLVLDGCTFEDNWALVAGGAGLFVLSSSIPGPTGDQPNTFGPLYPLSEGTFTPPTTGQGLETNGRVFLLNSVFTNNSASTAGGGAVAITQQTEMLVSNCTFSENISPKGYGGAISGTDCRGSINVYSSHFLNNSASTFGGAIYTTSCNLTLMDSKMAGNTAATAGALNSQLSIRDAASPGLALTELTHCECSDNLATTFNGGCVVADSVQLRLEGGSFTGNVARMGNGGAVSVSSQGSLRMSNVHNMTGNVATIGWGGAIWLTNTRLVDINSSTISANTAVTAGCVNADQVSCVIMQNTTIQNCYATITSGGMNFQFAVNSSGCTANDFASSLPSSVSPQLDAPSQQPISFVVYNSTFVNNSAFSGGGMGLQLNPGAGAYMQRLVMRANNASQTDGGGMYVQGSQFWDGTGAIKVQDSTFDSNTAQFGYGGAAFLINTVQSQIYQYRFTLANCTVEGNSASNGGGVATNGGGLFLDVSDGSVFESNTAVAPTVDGLTAIATGGCLHARGCQGLMVRGQSKFNSCYASAPGYSQGGAIMVDSCETLVVDQSSVSNSQANMGGGLAALHVQALLVVGSSFQGNKAVGSPAFLPSVIQNLIGAGGGAWIGGNTSGFLQGTQISDNVADTVGGGAVIHMKCPAAGGQTILVASQRPWAPMFVTVPASYSDFLARLQGLAFDQCFSLTVKQSSIFGNQAYHAGGGLFLSSVTGFQSDSCNDINHPVSAATPLPSLGPYVAQSNISGFVDCSRVGAGAPKRSLLQDNTTANTVVVGYGPDIATMAHRVDIERAETVAQVDPAVLELGGGNATVPQVRFVRSASGYEDVLVLPSASPLIFANVPVLVTDAAGQNIHDPLISSAITVTITPNVTALLDFSLIGQTVGVYDPVNKAYAFNGLGVRAKVGRNYLFSYNVTSAIQGGDQVPLLNVTVIVPDCADGEVYALEKTACYKCRSGYYAFAQAPGAVADECLPCPNGAQCTGGAVLVPDDMNWHSAPNSTEVHQCVNYRACKRPDDKIQALQTCQSAWYEFLNLRETMTNVELSGYAYDLLVKYNCTLLSVGDLYDRNAYGSLVCAEGYGGNMCGVCVPKYDGSKTALQSNSLCGSCGPQWQVILVSIAFFVVNMVLIIISVMSAMGEQILSNTIQFADIIGLLVMHMQYLVVVLRIQMSWPNEVVGLTRTVSAVTNFADQAIKVASLGCLSSTGTPESQAEYTMAGTLFIPAALLFAAMFLWVIFWLVRIHFIYPRMGIRMGSDLQLHHTLSIPKEHDPVALGISNSMNANFLAQKLGDDVAPTDLKAALAAAQPPLVMAATFAYRPEERSPDLANAYNKSGSAPASHYNATAAAVFASAGMPSITEDHNDAVDPTDVDVSVPNGDGVPNGDSHALALPPPALSDATRVASAHYPVINGSPPLADPAQRSATATHYRMASFPVPPMIAPSTTFSYSSTPFGAAQDAGANGYGPRYGQQSPTVSVISGSPPLADPAQRSATSTHYRMAPFPIPPMLAPSTTFSHSSTPFGAVQDATAGGYGSSYGQQSPGTVPPANRWAKLAAAVGNGTAIPAALNSASRRAQGDLYTADEADDKHAPSFDVPEKGKLLRTNSLIRWQLPGAEKMPVATSWFSTDDEARHARVIEDKFSLSLMEKLQLLDKYMPLPWQLAAVAINSAFVVYEGWCSAALSVFACQFIDSGSVEDPQPWYYANFQKATNPNGYWQLNMNQACYEGEHWYKWTPIGIIMSIVVCLGIPLATFLPVFLNRKTLTTPRTQMFWGWIYMRFYYNRVPYWAAFAQLELLALVITQTFTSGLESDLQQAAILQVVLLVILVINTIVWPHVHQLMTLMSFLSFAVLTLTVAFSILIGDGTAWTLPAAAAGCVGALMIIINVAYGIMLCLVSYKHTQDILEENYEQARKRASMVLTRFMRASKDANAMVRSVAAEASRTLAKTTEDSRVVRNMVSVIGRASRRVPGTRTSLSGMQEKRMSTGEAAARAVLEVDAEKRMEAEKKGEAKEAEPVQENGSKQV